MFPKADAITHRPSLADSFHTRNTEISRAEKSPKRAIKKVSVEGHTDVADDKAQSKQHTKKKL